MSYWSKNWSIHATAMETYNVNVLRWICPDCKKENTTIRKADSYRSSTRCGCCHQAHEVLPPKEQKPGPDACEMKITGKRRSSTPEADEQIHRLHTSAKSERWP